MDGYWAASVVELRFGVVAVRSHGSSGSRIDLWIHLGS